MKKSVIAAFVLVFALIFSGCSGQQNEPDKAASESVQSTDQLRSSEANSEHSEAPESASGSEKERDVSGSAGRETKSTTRAEAGESQFDSAKDGDPSTQAAAEGKTEQPASTIRSGESLLSSTRLAAQNETTRLNPSDSRCTVVFEDYDGTVLKKETVAFGSSATPPSAPSHTGYRFTEWNGIYRSVRRDSVVTATYEKITAPTLQVDKVNAKGGDTVCVKVHVLNSPGLLGLLMNITFDDNALTLKNVKNGKDFRDYMFTPPKNKKSGCNASWSITDVPENVKNGEIVELYFTVNKKAAAGSYPISVSCLKNAFDANYEVVPFDVVPGEICVK